MAHPTEGSSQERTNEVAVLVNVNIVASEEKVVNGLITARRILSNTLLPVREHQPNPGHHCVSLRQSLRWILLPQRLQDSASSPLRFPPPEPSQD